MLLNTRFITRLQLALLWLLPLSAAALELKFTDAEGNPVPQVVIELLDAGRAVGPDPSPVMDQVDRQFVPHVLLVGVGQSVQFPNSDNIRHHVYSFSEAKPFEIKMFKGSDADPVLFDRAGIVVLGCNIHDDMLGFIYVAGEGPALISDEVGRVDIPDSTGRARIWHPRLSADHARYIEVEIGALDATVPLDLLPPKKREVKRTFKSRFYGR